MNKPLVVSKHFVAGLLPYDVFIDISWLFHPQYHKYLPFFMTALSAHVVLSVLYSTFPTLSKLTYSTYSVKITQGEMNLFSLGISNRVFLILHLVVVTMVITQSLSFLLPQHKIRFFFSKHWPEAHLTFYFSLYIYISIYCPDTWESFIQDFPYPVTPKSDYPVQYHLLIKHLGHRDKGNDHQLKKVLIINKSSAAP